MHDLIIIGGGPAGVSAAVYAARKRLKTVLIAEKIGGQSFDSNEIQNWIGTEKISGQDLAGAFEKHLQAYVAQGLELRIGERVEMIGGEGGGFSVKTNKTTYRARAILIATGGKRKQLGIPGAKEYENKGLTYCASCDGPLFAGQDTVVVGGGNAGFETAAQLLAYAKSVTLLHRGSDFSKADASTVEAVLKHKNMKVLKDTEPSEIKGDKFVSGVVVKNRKTGETSLIPAAGVFVEIGMVPSTDFAKGIVEMNEFSRIKVDHRTQRTSVSGIWAAGDSTDGLFSQNNIAAGDAVKALEDIYLTLHAQK